VGRTVNSGAEADILIGNALPLKNIPAGTVVSQHRATAARKGAQMARFSGCAGTIGSREGGIALLNCHRRDPKSNKLNGMATIGQVGNVEHENESHGKAGKTRWLGKKPHNRGVSMNPVDHPHGRRRGQNFRRTPSVTPWGQPTRGFKTRNNKRTDKWIVSRKVERRGAKGRIKT